MEEEIKHYAVVNKTTSIVENVIVADNSFKSIYEEQNIYIMLVEYKEKPINDDEVARIGETYIEGVGFRFDSQEPIIVVPKSITMRQARLYLLSIGKLDDVEIIVAQNRAWYIEWEYANEVLRTNQLISALQQSLGLSDSDIDSMFIEASKL